MRRRGKDWLLFLWLAPCAMAFLYTTRLSYAQTRRRPCPDSTSRWSNVHGGGGDSVSSPSRVDRLGVLQDWLLEQGVEMDLVTLRGASEGDMGMFAAQDLAQGQVLFTVSDRLILRPPSDGRETAGGLSSQAVLALQILYERQLGPKSALYPYINSLPSAEEMHMPLLWTEEEAELLGEEDGGGEDMTLSAWRAWVADEGTRATELLFLHAAQDQASSVQVQGGGEEEGAGNRWMHRLAGLRFDVHDWLWARAIALSRAYLMDPGDEWSLALIPLVDMSNHEDGCTCAILDNRVDGSIGFRAVKPFAKGQEVWSSYGPLHGALKLFTWGYLEDMTVGGTQVPKQGYVQLSVDLTPSLPALEAKRRILTTVGGLGPEGDAESWRRGGVGGGGGAHRGPLQEVTLEVLVTVRRANADTGRAGVVLDNEAEVKRVKQALRILLLDEEDINDGRTDAELWAAAADEGDEGMEEDVIAVLLQECQRLMKDVAPRLSHCLEQRQQHTAHSQGQGGGQGEGGGVHGYRLRLAEMWLRGQLMALQALAEYLLKGVEEEYR